MKKNCLIKNCCGNYTCCYFCKKTCEYRCKGYSEDCRYLSSDEELKEVKPFNKLEVVEEPAKKDTSKEDRNVLILKDLETMSFSEVADKYNLSQARIRRIKKDSEL